MSAPSTERNSLDLVDDVPGIPRDAGSSGTFALGREVPVEAVRESSDWSAPMRMAVTGWLVFSAVVDVYVVFQLQDAIRQAAFPTAGVNSGTVSSADALGTSRLAFNIALTGLVVWLVVKAFLLIGAYAGRSAGVFFVCLGLAGVDALLGLVSLVMIAIDLGHAQDATVPLVSLLVQATAAALFVWMFLGLRRYGPWATASVPPPSA